MITQLIDSIHSAEAQAEKIIAEAHFKAAEIEKKAQKEIETISDISKTKEIHLRFVEKNINTKAAPQEEIIITVGKEKLDFAKKYLIAKFNERYTK